MLIAVGTNGPLHVPGSALLLGELKLSSDLPEYVATARLDVYFAFETEKRRARREERPGDVGRGGGASVPLE